MPSSRHTSPRFGRTLKRALLGAITAVLFLFGSTSSAWAVHLQGGFFTAKVTADGKLQGTATYLEVTACPSGVGSQKTIPMTVTSPNAEAKSFSLQGTATRCLTGGSTYVANFDIPLNTTTFLAGAPDGNYVLQYLVGNRIAGIVNLANSGSASVRFRAQVRKKTGIATSAPFLGSDVALGIGIGELYSQNLNASDPDDVLGNGTLTYTALTGSGEYAPETNVISIPKLTANGQIEIPTTTTSGMANNAKYVYKVRVTDDQGDFAERDVLLTATTPNKPPVISGLSTVAGYDIGDGQTQVINFTATDPNGANAVTISGAGLPSWATLSQTTGNPAQGTLTLSPPVDANTRKYRLNFDAIDNDSVQPLTGSATVEVRVQGAPETQLLTQPAALTTATNANFTFAAADPSYTFECRFDSAAWAACTSPTTYTGLSDGPRTFQVRANDGTRVDPTPASFTWTIDTTPPTTTIATKPAAQTNSTTANFTFTANETGNVTYECSLDNGAFTACTTPKSYTGLADGSHNLRVRATDTLGHVETTPSAYTWVIDRTAPDTSIVTGPSGLVTANPEDFTFTATEPGSTFECKLDAGAWTACTSPQTYTSLADGSHTVQVRATDAAGNVDATPASRTFTVDTVAPTTQITSGPAAFTQQTTASFPLTSDDGAATFECKLDSGSWAPCTSPVALTGLTDGNHELLVRSRDAAGNVDATPASYTWTVDTTAPTSTLTSGPTGSVSSGDASFGFSSPDGSATFECKLDAGTWQACTDPKSLTGLVDGSHTFQVRAVDSAGNVDTTPQSRTWTVDTVAPTTSVTSGPAALTTLDSATFVLASDDGAATFECKLDSGSWQPCTSPKNYTGLPDGNHELLVRATDAAGNTDATPESYTWSVDSGAPNTNVTGTPAAVSPLRDPSFTFGSSDSSATFECKLDGGTWQPCASPKALTALTDGDHTLEIRATDTAGNVETTPFTYTWTVDATVPATPVLEQSPAANSTTSNFVFNVEPGATVECQVDGGAWVPCSASFSPTLGDGTHTVKVRQTDPAGNVSGEATHTWIVDTAAPEAPVTVSGPTGTATTKDTTFDFTAEPGSTVECRLDSGDWAPCVSPLDLGELGVGEHLLELRATDAAGNVSSVRTERWTIAAEPAKSEPAKVDPVKIESVKPAAIKVEISRSVAIDPAKSTVGCRLEGVSIDKCEVAIYALKSDLGLAKRGSAEDTLVRIGTGKATADGDSGRLGVKVTLNSTGKQAMKRVGGIKARVNIKATASTGGDKLYAHRYTKIRPASQLVVPTDGLFATDSAAISLVGKRYLQSIGGGLYGASSIECVGHTDASGAASYNARLGLARAKAVCAYLTRLGVNVAKRTASAGESQPRATNLTAAGRGLNRRVELNLRYR